MVQGKAVGKCIGQKKSRFHLWIAQTCFVIDRSKTVIQKNRIALDSERKVIKQKWKNGCRGGEEEEEEEEEAEGEEEEEEEKIEEDEEKKNTEKAKG